MRNFYHHLYTTPSLHLYFVSSSSSCCHHHHTEKKLHEKKTQEVSDFSEREKRRVMRNFENNLNANILQLKLFPFSAPLLLLLS